MYINSISLITREAWYSSSKQKKANETTNTILFYSLSENYIYHQYYDRHIERDMVYNPEASAALGGGTGSNKREYLGIKPKTRWLFSDENMKSKIESGEVYRSGNKLKQKKSRFGFLESDVWKYTNNSPDYPTQKSYKLLERIICIATL
jgi:hypothetical protein